MNTEPNEEYSEKLIYVAVDIKDKVPFVAHVELNVKLTKKGYKTSEGKTILHSQLMLIRQLNSGMNCLYFTYCKQEDLISASNAVFERYKKGLNEYLNYYSELIYNSDGGYTVKLF